MLDRPDIPHWPTLLRPLADASSALGQLTFALKTTPLHPAWLWRETTRTAAKIAQNAGHKVQTSRLCQALAGLPMAPSEDEPGLAAARRVFLVAAPLFRTGHEADFNNGHHELFEPLWAGHRPDGCSGGEAPQSEDSHPGATSTAGVANTAGRASTAGATSTASSDVNGVGDRPEDRQLLLNLVRELAGFAGTGAKPALIDLFLDLRQHGTARHLPPSLVRLALPLALHQAGLVPKAAPGLLGGRLPLGTTRSPDDETSVTTWLNRGLSALAEEGRGASRRLVELTRQHRAWRDCLADAGLRGHARTPFILDLLAATPVLSASLVARHLGCSTQAAGQMLRRLVDFGIVTEATSRSRFKIYLAGDLTRFDRDRSGDGTETPLAISEPLPEIDREAVETSLDELFSDLERLDRRAKAALTSAGNDQGRRAGGK